MKAISVEPKKPGGARYEDAPEPDERDGSVLVEDFARALQRSPDDMRVVLQLAEA